MNKNYFVSKLKSDRWRLTIGGQTLHNDATA